MLYLNLFHEQQQIQREKDFDPVRLTILGGALLVTVIIVWAVGIYLGMGQLRSDLADNKNKSAKKEKEFKALGMLTDLPKIQSQTQSLQNRTAYRTLFANQLDSFRNTIPTNCQVLSLKTTRLINPIDIPVPGITVPGKKAGPPIVKKMMVPTLDITFQVSTQAKSKIEVLQIRDQLLEVLQKEQESRVKEYRNWLHQERLDSATNVWKEVAVFTVTAQDPKEGEMAVGIFEYKTPIFLKDQPKEP